MQVKEIERTANVAWSPRVVQPVYLACGTAAQQLDASFSTSAALEVYLLNLQDPSNELTLVSSVPTEQRFHAVTWGAHGGNQGTIVGGCDAGIIQVFNASKLLQKSDGLVGKFEKHAGSVRALDFNKYQNNLLASGAAESEIFIWDLNNPSTPMAPGTRVQPLEDLTSLEWNNQVQHILATAFSSRCVVWDLRKNDPIIKLTDTSCRLRWCSVAWNPDVATQLCLASEDDQSPFIQLWDLRFATSPVKVLSGHQKGVLSLSWCQQDTEMLLSCGKDNRILCWNPNSPYQGGELICEITSPSQWNFSVSWCPRNPALFSTCSFDGHVSVNSLQGGPQQPQTSTKIADSFPGMELYSQAPPLTTQTHSTPIDLKKPPKWMKRPTVARFGFGGKLVMTEQKTVTVCQVTSEPAVVARANLLDSAVRHDNCLDFCKGKVASATEENERTLWQFLSASFSSNPKEEYISLLGFQRQDITSKLSQLKLRNGPSERLATLGRSTDTESDLDASDEVPESRNPFSGDGAENTMFLPQPHRRPRSYKISTTDDVDGLICEALLLGDVTAAVELCVEDARWADAIILAMTGGADLLASTQHRYLQENPGTLSKLVLAAVTEDWQPVIENCDSSSWREALVAALTHSSDDFPQLCEVLGSRLNPRIAQLCFLCAGNIDRLVTAWLQNNRASSPENLQDLVEIIILLKRAVELRGRTVNISGQISDILSRYAIILASEGNLEMALAYLESSQDEGMAFLRERIYRAAGLGGQQPKYTQNLRNTKSGYPNPQPVNYQTQSYPNQSTAYQPSYADQNTPSFYKPPGPAEQPQPPPSTFAPVRRPSQPPSVSNEQAGLRTASPALGKAGRPKHVLDPSVASTPAPSAFYPPPNPSAAPYQQPQSYGINPPLTNPYGVNQDLTNRAPPPPSIASFPSQPPGWNDPPPLSSSSRLQVKEMSAQHAGTRKWREVIAHSHDQQKKEVAAPPAPITAPLLGAPEPTINGVYDPYQTNNYSAAPPPPSFPPPQQSFQNYPPPPPQANFSVKREPPTLINNLIPAPPPQANFPQQREPPNLVNNYPPPPLPQANLPPQREPPPPVNNFAPQPPPSLTSQPQNVPLRPPSVPAQTGFSHQTQPPQFPSSNFGNYAPTQPTPPPPTPVPPQPVKKALPEEHIHLQTVLDELKSRCIAAATNPQSKRKLDDVSRKLEVLYDSLADGKLSNNTVQSLHGIVQRVQNGDYTGGLSIHSQLVSGPDFAQIASFMPGIKILLQTALQLQVYL